MKVQRTKEEQCAIDAYFERGGMVTVCLIGGRTLRKDRNGTILAAPMKQPETSVPADVAILEGFDQYGLIHR